MFYRAKELQFDARVSGPDPRFASILLEQFGGPNGELKAAMQYFVQAFAAKKPFPDKYDLLMDIAAEELSHLEIVGATIQMLLQGVNGKLKDAAEKCDLAKLLGGNKEKEHLASQAFLNPQFFVLTGGGPRLTDSQGVPWQGSYVSGNGDLTVDLRSNIAAESRAKIVYEYLMQFTDDPHVVETLRFLMTREIAHFQQFSAALTTIEPNFPPGILQGDPRYTHVYFNMTSGQGARGPWNQGQGPWAQGESWVYVEDTAKQVMATSGLTKQPVEGTKRTPQEVDKVDHALGRQRSQQVTGAAPPGPSQWSEYAKK